MAMPNVESLYKVLSRKVTLDDVGNSLSEERGKGKGVGGPRQGDGGATTCVCPKCGAKYEHTRGTPCLQKKCAKCGVSLIGESRGKGMGVGGPRQGDAGAAYCMCMGCGEVIKHERGEPCNQQPCPRCGGVMIGASARDVEQVKNEAKRTKGSTRGTCVLPVEHPKVEDNKDHYPINTAAQARNALARVAQYDDSPPWFKGSLKQLQAMVRKAVKKAYPSIEVTEQHTFDNDDGIVRQCLDCGTVFVNDKPVCFECGGSNVEVLSGTNESVVQEQSFKTVAKGIADEDVAKKIAADSGGVVVEDSEDKDKFAVIIKEAAAPMKNYGEMLGYEFENSVDVDLHIEEGEKELLSAKVPIKYTIEFVYKSWGIGGVYISPIGNVLLYVHDKGEEEEQEIKVPLDDIKMEWVPGDILAPRSLRVEIDAGTLEVKSALLTVEYIVPKQ